DFWKEGVYMSETNVYLNFILFSLLYIENINIMKVCIYVSLLLL
ncbi:Os09g0246300, partial [Oryza sativa Japonica Group]